MDESGNQQERPRSLEWVAGLVQGEGCFTVVIQRVKGNKHKVIPTFSLHMKDEGAINKMVSILNENHLAFYVTPVRKDMHGVQVMGAKRALRMARALEPYLVGQKLRAAQLVAEFASSRLSRPQNSQYSDEEIDLIAAIRDNNAGGRGKISPESLRGKWGNGAHHRDKTHCKNGHPYSPENTIIHNDKNGQRRRCRICDRKYKSDWRKQKLASLESPETTTFGSPN